MKLLLSFTMTAASALALVAAPSWQDAIDAVSVLPRSFPGVSSAPSYQTASAEVGEVVKTVMATGALIPALNVEVGSLLSGQISALKVDFNDKVRKGQVLAELDDRSYALAVSASRAALEAARADLRGAEARLERVGADARLAELQRAVLATRVASTKSLLDMADRESRRKAWLQERGAAGSADAQDAISKRESAAASVREAEAVLENQSAAVEGAQADLKKAQADVLSMRSTVAKLAAQLESAEVDLERTKIRSPVDGLVVGRNVTEGQTLATTLEAKTLFTIAGDLDHMDIDVRVDESDIAKIKVGQRATFTVDAFPHRTFHASVKQVRIAPQVVQNVVTYTVVLTTANPGNILLPGMTVLARIVTDKTPPETTVPLAALRYRPKHLASAAEGSRRPALWVLDDGRPRRIAVVPGEDDGTKVAVRSGDLHAGDRVIVGDGAAKQARTEP